MKRRSHRPTIAAMGALLLTLLLGSAVQAQGEKFQWNTYKSGGGVVENSSYTLRSAIGGPIAGTVSNVSYTLCSGTECPEISEAPAAPGSFQFSQSSYTVAEDGGTATITVQRVGGSEGAASVNYTTSDGSADAGSDYTTASGTLNFSDGQTSQDFAVTINDDSTPESTETVNLTLSSPTGGTSLGSPAAATLNITDNDDAVVINEFYYLGGLGEDWIELKNVGNTTVDISNWQLCSQINYGRIGDQPILAGDDYSLAPGEIIVLQAWRDLDNSAADLGLYKNNTNFADPANMVDFVQYGTSNLVGRSAVAVQAGMWREISSGVYDFVPTASAGQSTQYDGSNSGGGLETWSTDFDNGSPSQGAENSNVQPAGSLQFSMGNYVAGEGDGTVTVTVERTGGSSGTVTVDYATADGSATAPGDYAAISGTLTFSDGVTSQQFGVTVVDDGDAESAETINLTLSNPSDGAGLGTPSAATITINDNDSGPSAGNLQFSQSTYTVGENVGTAAITVQRVGGSSGTVTVQYATSDGSATAPGDYNAASGTLTFGDGVTSQGFNVTIVDDDDPESTESINLTLSNPTGGAGLGSPGTAAISITDNDSGPSGLDLYLPKIFKQ